MSGSRVDEGIAISIKAAGLDFGILLLLTDDLQVLCHNHHLYNN